VKVATGANGISGTAFDVLIGGPDPRAVFPPVPGTLTQLPGSSGCLVAAATPGCQPVRALQGPGPLLGSHAVALSPDGRNVYVASTRSQAIAAFRRNQTTGRLTQMPGRDGCVAAGGTEHCGSAVGLGAPVSVAVSPDGNNVYATSAQGSSVAVFRRNPITGALTQLTGTAGCVAGMPQRGCANARALVGPDVVAVSADGKNVYVGAFFGAAVVTFSRSGSTGALTQLPGSSGCIADATPGCASGFALRTPEGLAVSADGNNVYVAAALSDAVDVLARDPATGALTQATDGTGCLASTPQSGCATARALKGADAVAISPDDGTVYIAGGISAGIAVVTRDAGTGHLTQPAGTAGCVQRLRVEGCSLGRPLVDPEGLAVTPDGAHVFATMYISSALDVFDRDPATGSLIQKPNQLGCFTTTASRGCTPVRGGVRGVSSAAVSPDGKYLYAVANLSNSLTAFRITQ
jgi:DNA-binding beta-propeller fold protein YncE